MIGYERDKPDVFELEGAGYVEYYEFENDIWVKDCYAYEIGKGNALAKAFIALAKEKGKSIHGEANPQGGGMNLPRLMEWYRKLGGERIHMNGHPTAMKMEIKDG